MQRWPAGAQRARRRAETTWGSWAVAVVRSIRAPRPRSARPSIGAVMTRGDASPQVGQRAVAGALPIGCRSSTGPSAPHR
ncbi:hypothetical protein [Pseudonocardia sp. ICBG601]|uniref:hypothetical protein n=1 Tax=Pseudonocardia sp. ICBG601 TaxID=2846759 RepID=UPI001CF62CAF|nr:hypothetical protein [Pseudonocardia sp. ICBG601]